MSEKTITVDYIARVEGEADILVKIKGKDLKELKLKIFEPPRFFEGFLVGRRYDEVPDIVGRICGLCPISHMTAGLRAIENAMNLEITDQTKDIRRLLTWSQIMSSHIVHLYMLALPDYFGYKAVTEMIPKFEVEVNRLIKMKTIVNNMTSLIGGRCLHPVIPIVNGFTTIPPKHKLDSISKKLREIIEDAKETIRAFANLPYPDFNQDTEFLAIHDANEYAVNKGSVMSSKGLNIPEARYEEYIDEKQVSHSMAKHCTIKNRGPYMVGALSRVNLNYDQLSDSTKSLAKEISFKIPDNNPFHNNIAQALETLHGIETCIETIEKINPKEEENIVKVREGWGCSVVEAPRGSLYHSYKLNRNGIVEKANVVAPTTMNSMNMEKDLRKLVKIYSDSSDDKIAALCEMLVRAYDPCFSCSVH
jgi:coenzyme F420-reducing hydrogenase alpha subunit